MKEERGGVSGGTGKRRKKKGRVGKGERGKVENEVRKSKGI